MTDERTPGGGRDEIAAFLFARDEASVSEGVTPNLLQWGRGQISLGKNAVHSGDCTQECHSCARCAYENAVRDADAIIAITLRERGVEREAIIEECARIIKSHLVGYTLTPGGLAREDTALEILDAMRGLRWQGGAK